MLPQNVSIHWLPIIAIRISWLSVDNSVEAKFIAARVLGDPPESKSITIDDVEMDAYLIKFEEGAA